MYVPAFVVMEIKQRMNNVMMAIRRIMMDVTLVVKFKLNVTKVVLVEDGLDLSSMDPARRYAVMVCSEVMNNVMMEMQTAMTDVILSVKFKLYAIKAVHVVAGPNLL